MDDGIHVLTKSAAIAVPQSVEGQRSLLEAASGIEGVQESHLAKGELVVSYVAEAVSLRIVEAELQNRGFELRPVPAKRKGFFARFLERTAESNYRSFGSEPLDCCTLHQKKAPQQRS